MRYLIPNTPQTIPYMPRKTSKHDAHDGKENIFQHTVNSAFPLHTIEMLIIIIVIM